MESKFKLRLNKSIDENSLNSATVLCLSTEYLIDITRDMFKRYNKDGKVNDYLEEFTSLVNQAYEVSFSNFNAWNLYKSNIFVKMLDMVKRCGEYLTANAEIPAGQVIDGVQGDLNEFVMSLGSIIVDHECLDLNGAVVKKEYIDSTIEQLTLMSESVVLCNLVNAHIELTPATLSSHKNEIVEKKLKSLVNVTESARKAIDEDLDKLIDLIMSMNKRFYKLSNSKMTDAEKVENARKLVKELNPHKKLLDKLENKLTKGNELKRQLTLNKAKLVSNMNDEIARIDDQIKEDPENADIYENNKNSLQFVTDTYVVQIDKSIKNINAVEEDIAERYKMLDLLQSSLKSSIPTEGEMNKLSAVAHKFQELANKQENAKSTIEDKEIKKLLGATIQGMYALIECGKDLKEIYMRNSLLSATFKTCDVILDFAESTNKGEKLTKMLVVNKTLDKYTKLSIKMAEDFFACRKIANDTSRNIAMTMCKNYTKTSLKEISKSIEICYKEMDSLLKNLDAANREEVALIIDLLSL